MSTLLMDTALIKLLATPRAAPLLQWCEANNADLFLSAASLTEIVGSIDKMSPGQAQRAQALRNWLDGLTSSFADRIHPVDATIATRAGGCCATCRATAPAGRSTTLSSSRRPRRTATGS